VNHEDISEKKMCKKRNCTRLSLTSTDAKAGDAISAGARPNRALGNSAFMDRVLILTIDLAAIQ
jgi:hypothetical protein